MFVYWERAGYSAIDSNPLIVHTYTAHPKHRSEASHIQRKGRALLYARRASHTVGSWKDSLLAWFELALEAGNYDRHSRDRSAYKLPHCRTAQLTSCDGGADPSVAYGRDDATESGFLNKFAVPLCRDVATMLEMLRRAPLVNWA